MHKGNTLNNIPISGEETPIELIKILKNVNFLINTVCVDDLIEHKSLTEEVVDEFIAIIHDFYTYNKHDILITLMRAGKLTVQQVIEDVLCHEPSQEVIDYLKLNMIDKDYTSKRISKLKERYLNNQTIDNLLLISYEFEDPNLIQFVLDNLSNHSENSDFYDDIINNISNSRCPDILRQVLRLKNVSTYNICNIIYQCFYVSTEKHISVYKEALNKLELLNKVKVFK